MKTVIKKQFVHVEEAGTLRPEPLTAAEASSPTRTGPAVRVIELDGVVQAIEVTCACGEVTLVELELDPGTGRSASPRGEDS